MMNGPLRGPDSPPTSGDAASAPGADNPREAQGTSAEDRSCADRRKQPTAVFSRYTFFGRRRRNRRDDDPNKRYFVDRADGPYLKVLFAILLFIIVDIFSTLYIIGQGGCEANPIMDWVLQQGKGCFISVKGLTALFGFLLLGASRYFPIARPLAAALLLAYGGIVIYHLYLLLWIHL